MVSQDGYTLRLAAATAPAGQDVPVAFTSRGPDGKPVTGTTSSTRSGCTSSPCDATSPASSTFIRRWHRRHLVVALDLEPGTWRLFADFKPTGADAAHAGGRPRRARRRRPRRARDRDARPSTVDGYTVTLDRGPGRRASTRCSTLWVSTDGRPVTDLQPYLGAYGHLVALREGDLAYLHVHPDGEPGDGKTEPGPESCSAPRCPAPARYHLYLDFKHDGVVRTASSR